MQNPWITNETGTEKVNNAKLAEMKQLHDWCMKLIRLFDCALVAVAGDEGLMVVWQGRPHSREDARRPSADRRGGRRGESKNVRQHTSLGRGGEKRGERAERTREG